MTEHFYETTVPNNLKVNGKAIAGIAWHGICITPILSNINVSEKTEVYMNNDKRKHMHHDKAVFCSTMCQATLKSIERALYSMTMHFSTITCSV